MDTQRAFSRLLSELGEVGPETLSGKFLRSFWHPVLLSSELLDGRPRQVQLLGEDIVVFRGNDGAPYSLSAFCGHRHAPLVLGWVEGTTLRCRYHGWRFNEQGRCVEAPGERDSICERSRVSSYPAREHAGLIFIYLGSIAPPEFRPILGFEQGSLATNLGTWPCNYFDLLESAVDWTHVSFAHRVSGTAASLPSDYQPKYSRTDYGIRCESKGKGATHLTKPTHLHMPTSNRFSAQAKDSHAWVDFMLWRTPNNRENTTTFLVSPPGHQFPASDVELSTIAGAVLAGVKRLEDLTHLDNLVPLEDYVCIVGSGFHDRAQDVLGRGDLGVALLRRIWMEELHKLKVGMPLTEWRPFVPDIE